MIKVSILYPGTEGARFDHDYYRDRHVPMCAELLGDAVQEWGVEKGLNAGRDGMPAPYVAACWFTCASWEDWEAASRPVMKQILADVPAYTEITPVMQVSDVVR